MLDIGVKVTVNELNNRFNGQSGTIINIGRNENRKVYFVELENGMEKAFYSNQLREINSEN